ncbi:MAG TPA: recombinase RecT [Polyangia bacterium]|nr:recombinase RecT [Polyangia bacterium]
MSLRDRVKDARAGQTAGQPGPAVEGTVMPAQPDQRAAVQVSGYGSAVEALRQREELFNRAAPDGGPTGVQLITDTVTALSTVKGLDECDPRTIVGAVMTCAQLGLRVGGATGQAYVLPFWNNDRGRREATFVLGYKGLVKLAMQSGLVRGIVARTVYEKELPSFRLSWHEDRDELVHEPWLLDDKPGAPVLYYARALLNGGGYQLTRPVHRDAMKAHRARYVRIKSGPWFDDRGVAGDGFEAMAHKTVGKQLGKWLPLSATARQAIAADGGVRHNDSPDAPVDEVTEHAGDSEADVEPGQTVGNPDAAYDEAGWPAGAQPRG